MSSHLQKIYDQAYFAYLYFWGGKKSGFINYGYWKKGVSQTSSAHFLLFEKLFELVSEKKFKSILDLGSGFGGAALAFLKASKANYSGVTHSQKQIELSKQRCKAFLSKAKFYKSDYTSFFKTNRDKFDLIWAVESIYHETNKKQFLEYLHKITNTDGRVLIVDYFLEIDDDNSNKINTWTNGYKVGEIQTADKFHSSCLKAGFKVIKNLDWSTHVLEGSRRIAHLGKWSILPVAVFAKLGLFSNDFLLGTKASIVQYELLKQGKWQYRVFVLKRD